MDSRFGEEEFLACCGSTKFAKEMSLSVPSLKNFEQILELTRDIWFNKVNVNGWLEAFAAHPQIGGTSSQNQKSQISTQWSKGEQSTALMTATDSTLQELLEWNVCYREKFGFVFLICASGRSTTEILTELKKRYPNKPIVEFEIAAQEQMKITELRLTKLYFPMLSSSPSVKSTSLAAKAGEDRVSIIGSHLTAGSEAFNAISAHGPSRTRPPITTHVLDVSRGSPAAGIEVKLEKWKGSQPSPSFSEASDSGGAWVYQRTSSTDNDGRSGHLMEVVDNVEPGIYRMSFNTGKYCPDGFFPYVSIVFEIKESQKMQHFHVPLLFSPFSLTTYRGS